MKEVNGLRRRFDALAELSNELYRMLESWHRRPPEERRRRRKFDGSRVLGADEDIGRRAWEFWRERFPDDSFDGEENPNLVLGADWSMHIDPVDPTSELDLYRQETPKEHQWASVLLSATYRKAAVMFAVATPIRGRLFVGNTVDGVYLNRLSQFIPMPTRTLVINHDESAHRDILALFGYPRSYMVAPALALMLEGVAWGGVHPIDRPYEANCLLAAARSIGAHATDEFGHECHVGDEIRGATARFVWSRGTATGHDSLLKEIRERMRTS